MDSLETGSFETGALESKNQSTPKKQNSSTIDKREAETTKISTEAEDRTHDVPCFEDLITEEELFHQQVLMSGESQPDNIKQPETAEEKQLPGTDQILKDESHSDLYPNLPHQTTPSSSKVSPPQTPIMGQDESKVSDRNHPKYIISEDPQNERRRVEDSVATGNCVPWSDNVYYKLFLDTEGRNARLMVLKCEISYVDVFTDDEHSLYKSRFIGGKADGVAELFAFDLMKSDWEKKIPQSQAIELNVDIVMSSSPIHQCSETLLNLLQLEKSYLKHQHFDGQLNVMIRFAHPYAWDVKDDAIRERVHNGLRGLFREGVNLEVMSDVAILEEMRVDNILVTDDVKIKSYVAKRQAWTAHPDLKPTTSQGMGESKQALIAYNHGDAPSIDVRSTSSKSDATLSTMTDSYYVSTHSALWDIIQDTKRIKGILEETIQES